MLARVRKWLRRLGMALGLVLITVFAVRAWDAWRAPPLKLWHTEVPHELDAAQIDAADWKQWMVAESHAFDEMRARVTDQLPVEDRVRTNRFFSGSPMHAGHFTTDWNRSYTLTPDGVPRGAVVLLHGLTDSPYSLRHIAVAYRERGFTAVSVRLPGHGTVPAGLTAVRWEDWMAATRLAVREARALAGDKVPLHLVGYSNGGALAIKYALDCLDDDSLRPPEQIVLVSPMIGITSLARFSGVLGWPAVFPSFAKAAWLDVLPEYNPFKYNSFPVNGARQSSQLVRAVEDQLAAAAPNGILANFPPVLTFQSVFDATVVGQAIVDTLYRRLPDNGSEIVIFDRNRNAEVDALIRPENSDRLKDFVANGPYLYTVTAITNWERNGPAEAAETLPAKQRFRTAHPIAGAYPRGTYSLSHVALPFPPDDGLYGSEPNPAENFGVHLGTTAVRGERGVLIVNTETLMRASSNPFFGYLIERIDARIAAR